MKLLILISVLLVSSSTALDTSAPDINLKELECLVCKAVTEEYVKAVNKIGPNEEIEIGQYQLDSVGNAQRKRVPRVTSETHLSGMLDDICKSMDDYVRATFKSNGTLTLFKLITDGGLNPIMSDVDIVQDSDLNKSVEYFCTKIVGEYNDEFIEAIIKKAEDVKGEICTNYCRGFEDDSDKTDDPYKYEDEDLKTEL